MGQGSFTTLPLDHRRRARRRLVEGQAGPAARLGRQDVRQSGLWRHVPDVGERLRARLLQAAAHRGRAGAPRAARCGGGEMERAGRRAFDRAERGRAQGLEPAHELWRDRGLREGAGRAAEDRGEGPQAAASFRLIGKDVPRVEVPPKVTGAAKYAHGRAGPRHGLRRGAAVALSRRRAARRSTMPRRARSRASPTW